MSLVKEDWGAAYFTDDGFTLSNLNMSSIVLHEKLPLSFF